MVEARTAVERRKASAPSARRAPHPKMRLQCCAFRRSASLRFYLEAATFLAFVPKTRMQKTHRENEIAFLSAPAIAGEGGPLELAKRANRGGGGARTRRFVIVAGSPEARIMSM